MITIAERYHDFSAGHKVTGHENKCGFLHGHNYRVHFSVAGELDKVGRVLDFSIIKKHLCDWLEESWDHRFLIWAKDDWASALVKIDPKVRLVSFNPTAENMAEYLVKEVGPVRLRGTGVTLVKCKVEETPKCSATVSL